MDILKIKQFLSYGDGDGYGNGYGYGYGNGYGNGNGDGYGYGNGYGNGYGDGYGDGYGNGYGDGDGYGDGYGYGYGDGYGIKSINGYDVYRIDDMPTIFTHIHGNVATGYILEQNVVLTPCYIVRSSRYFAHGETLAEAQSALEEKIIDDMDVDEKISLFKDKFPDVSKKYAVKDFYQWHHNLTGSCEIGRKAFANSHNIDIDNDFITVKEFITLTENAYCGNVIKQLKASYKELQNEL